MKSCFTKLPNQTEAILILKRSILNKISKIIKNDIEEVLVLVK